MRSGKAVRNSIVAIIGQIVSLVCGLILPRLILGKFGSSYNGITNSITQFLSCTVLLRAGIGGVTRAALYKPLAENNHYKVSAIINATQNFMKKVAFIFASIMVIFAAIYPKFVSQEFDWFFSFSLVLIIGLSSFVQNYFGITYQILVESDQSSYVYNITCMISTLLNTVIAAILISVGANIHIVKLGSTIAYSINPLVLNWYASKKYKIDIKIPEDKEAISQRWDAFAQQAATIINNNTDIIVLTLFTNMKEVSVYSVYAMIVTGLYNFENAIVNSFEPMFGDMLARKEKNTLHNAVEIAEFVIFQTASFFFICGGVLIVPFVDVYTSGISDVNYIRPLFGYLFCINQFLYCARFPYTMLVNAAGHFKQTRNGAILEAIINITISIVLASKLGIIGVMIGTFCAMMFRTIQYSYYASKNILDRKIIRVFRLYLISVLEAVAVVSISRNVLADHQIGSYSSWLALAIIVALLTISVITVFSIFFFRKEIMRTIKIAKQYIIKLKST